MAAATAPTSATAATAATGIVNQVAPAVRCDHIKIVGVRHLQIVQWGFEALEIDADNRHHAAIHMDHIPLFKVPHPFPAGGREQAFSAGGALSGGGGPSCGRVS